MDDAARQAHIDRVRGEGFTIVEGAVAPGLIAALNDALTRLERSEEHTSELQSPC